MHLLATPTSPLNNKTITVPTEARPHCRCDTLSLLPKAFHRLTTIWTASALTRNATLPHPPPLFISCVALSYCWWRKWKYKGWKWKWWASSLTRNATAPTQGFANRKSGALAAYADLIWCFLTAPFHLSNIKVLLYLYCLSLLCREHFDPSYNSLTVTPGPPKPAL